MDLGRETYALPNIFLPFRGRYEYYRKATRGHNTLAFGDHVGFRTSDAADSDQGINVFSSLSPGGDWHGQGGVALRLNLSSAYANQLNRTQPHLQPSIMRKVSFATAELACLTINDEIRQNMIPRPTNTANYATNRSNHHHHHAGLHTSASTGFNVTWAFHTRAQTVELRGKTAILTANLTEMPDMQVQVEFKATPPVACSQWEVAPVDLPSHPPRFPVKGAKKMWFVCTHEVTDIQVVFRDLNSGI